MTSPTASDNKTTSKNAAKDAIDGALKAQIDILADFHSRSASILGSLIPLRTYSDRELSLERNLFSSLFLATQNALGIEGPALHLCGLASQCMRAWVTGCDNILDDEFKVVIPFDLPDGGTRFQSVLTIMVADRVFTDLVAQAMELGVLSAAQAMELSHLTLQALIPSGIQEHEEELGAKETLQPDELLERIHVPKTGLLFEAPISVADWMLPSSSKEARKAKQGLRQFGLACQILDDVVDFDIDLANDKHNYVHSVAAWKVDQELAAKRNAADHSLDAAHPAVRTAISLSCEKSARLFREAISQLSDIGLDLSEERWEHVVFMIPRLLRVPDHPVDCFRKAWSRR